jgi:leucyl-tRNA synthetase
VWKLVEKYSSLSVRPTDDSTIVESSEARDLLRHLHRTIKRVTEDIEDDFHFNTAISALMELVNEMHRFDPMTGPEQEREEKKVVLRKALETLLLLLSPFAPHIAEELWRKLGHSDSICDQPWPAYDAMAMAESSVLIVVQIDGRVRHRLYLDASSTEDEIRTAILSDNRIKHLLAGKQIKKMIVVPNRLVNIVLR